jgi:spore coat polysaccharide biosynthesis predicted glycosyltransferase SpsG
MRELLISMGGVDKDNLTCQVLQMIRDSCLPNDCRITVVMGMTAPWLKEVKTQANKMPWPTRVLAGTSVLEKLMADSDLAIGAAGATSWERCCMGLPAIVFLQAENQYELANALQRAGAAALVTSASNLQNQFAALLDAFLSAPQKLNEMSKASAAIVDGMGTRSVIAHLELQK